MVDKKIFKYNMLSPASSLSIHQIASKRIGTIYSKSHLQDAAFKRIAQRS